jgi:hypothetical protein
MTQVRNVRLEECRLHPIHWHVRHAFSPTWMKSDWRPRWWSLRICDQGLAAFQWPAGRYWRTQVRRGLSAGLGGLPPISGDSWPLTERGAVSSPSALIFARDHLVRIDAIDSRFLWKKIRLNERNGHHATFVLADREQIVLCARLLRRHFDQAI